MSSRGERVLRSDKLEIRLGDDGVGRVVVTTDQPLVGADAQALLDGLRAVSEGRRVPLWVDIRRLRGIDLGVRRVMASEQAGARISAAAVLVSNPLNRMIGSFFLKLNHPPFEMQLFDDGAAALDWALRHKEP